MIIIALVITIIIQFKGARPLEEPVTNTYHYTVTISTNDYY